MTARVTALALPIAATLCVLAVQGASRTYTEPGLRIASQAERLRDVPPGTSLRATLTDAEPPLPGVVAGLVLRRLTTTAPDAPLLAGARASALAAILALVVLGVVARRELGNLGAALAVGFTLLSPGWLLLARSPGPEALLSLGWALMLAGAVTQASNLGAALATAGLAVLVSSHGEAAVAGLAWLLWALLNRPPETSARPGLLVTAPARPAVLVPLVLAPLLLVVAWPHLHEEPVKRLFALVTRGFGGETPPVAVLGTALDDVTGGGPSFVAALFLCASRMALPLVALAGAGVVVRAFAHPGARFAALGLGAVLVTRSLTGGPLRDGVDALGAASPLLAWLAASGLLAALGHPALSVRIRGGAVVAVAAVLVVDLAAHFPNESLTGSAAFGGLSRLAAHTDIIQAPVLTDDMLSALDGTLPDRARLAFEPGGARYRPMIDTLIRYGRLGHQIESADTYHATHTATVRWLGAPGWPVQHTLAAPAFVLTSSGVPILALFER